MTPWDRTAPQDHEEGEAEAPVGGCRDVEECAHRLTSRSRSGRNATPAEAPWESMKTRADPMRTKTDPLMNHAVPPGGNRRPPL